MKKFSCVVSDAISCALRHILLVWSLACLFTGSALAFNMYPNSTIYVDSAAGLTATVTGQAENTSAGPLFNITSPTTLSAGQQLTMNGSSYYAGSWNVVNNGPSTMCVAYDVSSSDCTWILSPGGSADMWIGGGANVTLSKYSPPSCAAQNLTWGAGSFCSGSAATTNNGSSITITNSKSGATGSATAVCNSSAWSIGSSSCTVSLVAPVSLTATTGTVSYGINLSWGSVSGSSTYRLQYRKQGSSVWIDAYAGSSTTYSLTGLSDESTFEFQVRAENTLGASAWSSVTTGYIRKLIDPLFVSQSGIPAKIGVGQSFTYTQVWTNNGAETWTGGSYGTGPTNPANTSVWGTGVVVFSGSTATGSNITTSITATAPTTAGTYPLQRSMQKSGTAYGTASTVANVQVIGSPTCTAATPDTTTTYNSNATVTVSLQGASSVESASIKVWGSIVGVSSAQSYSMTLNGSTWTATFPISNHLSSGESMVNIQAFVANSLFTTPTSCATSTVAFQQLPVPVVTITPTVGSFTTSGAQGLVVNRLTGGFASVSVDLGAFNALKVKIEVLDATSAAVMPALPSVSAVTPTNLGLSASAMSGVASAWQATPATIRVSYADSGAASQGKVAMIPIAWMTTPGALTVSAQGTAGMPVTVVGKIGGYDSNASGNFSAGLRNASDGSTVAALVSVDSTGAWSNSGLDYPTLYNVSLIAVARAVPPAGVSLLSPWEYLSSAFTLPVQAPTSVDATDGTREDDVRVTWVAPVSTLKYRVFRDATEISAAGGQSALEFIDVPPQRGVTYTYSVKSVLNSTTSDSQGSDTGFVPACRAARLIGASMNADMSAMNGLIEKMDCLPGVTGTGAVDAAAAADLPIQGTSVYRSFSFPLDANLVDGAHVFHLGLISPGVDLNASRIYDLPLNLNRASITVKTLTILYDGSPAVNGQDATSIGRFGVQMNGGSGIGFAEEVK